MSSRSSEFSTLPKPKHKRFKKKKRRSKQKQLDCIKRDGRCRWCGMVDDTLVGHHIDSYGSSGIDELHNMITLCGKCHGDVGNGYLDRRRCNHPHILPEMFLGASSSGGSWKVYDPNKLLKRIMEENLV